MYKFLKLHWFIMGLCLAVILRIVYLDSIPAGIILSEPRLALSILNENVFNAFLNVLFYISNLFLKNSLLAVRFPFVLMSIGGIFGFYFLNKKFFSINYARVVTLVFAFTPWLIMASRSVDYWFFYFNLCLLILALVWKRNGVVKKSLKIGLTAGIIGIYIWFSFRHAAEQSLFKDIGIMNSINEMRGQGTLFKPVEFWSRLFFNKSYFLIKIFKREFELVKPQTYFSQLRVNHESVNTETGLFLSTFIVPFLIGCIYVMRNFRFRRWLSGMLIFLFFSFPLVVSRQLKLELLFPFSILISYLIAKGFMQIRKQKIVLSILLLISVYNLAFIIYQYVY